MCPHYTFSAQYHEFLKQPLRLPADTVWWVRFLWCGFRFPPFMFVDDSAAVSCLFEQTEQSHGFKQTRIT